MNTDNHVKRSSIEEIISNLIDEDGVGGRHRKPPLPPGGGGYLDICNNLKVSIHDLRQILRAPLLEAAAEKIGADNFVSMWKMVDELQNEGAWLRLPSFSKLEIFYRDKMIIAMLENGFSANQIKHKLMTVDIKISLRQVQRILQNHEYELVQE